MLVCENGKPFAFCECAVISAHLVRVGTPRNPKPQPRPQRPILPINCHPPPLSLLSRNLPLCTTNTTMAPARAILRPGARELTGVDVELEDPAARMDGLHHTRVRILRGRSQPGALLNIRGASAAAAGILPAAASCVETRACLRRHQRQEDQNARACRSQRTRFS